MHAFTGSDYTAGFFRKGKTRTVDMAEKSDQFLNAFGQLDTSADMDESVEDAFGAFVCSMYGKPKLTKIDDARYAVFRDKYAPKDEEQPLANIKGADESLLSPYYPALHKKILHTKLVAYLWENVYKSVHWK